MLAQLETLKSLEWTQEKMLDQARIFDANEMKKRELRKLEKEKMKSESQRLKVETMRDKLKQAFEKKIEEANTKAEKKRIEDSLKQ